jgi:hypothetical protein
LVNDRRSIFAFVACGLLLTLFAATSWLAWQSKGITFDEPLHLIGSVLQVREGNFRIDSENPPLWKYLIALSNNPILDMKLDEPPGGDSADIPPYPSVQDYATQEVYSTPANDARALVRAGRVRMLPLAVLLGALIAFWSWRLGGPLAACVSLAAYSLDPNFLAHGLLVKNDVPISLLFTAIALSVWYVGRRVTILNACTLAFLLAAALTTKFSGLLAIPVLAIALLLRAALPTAWPILRWEASTFASRISAAAIIVFFCLIVSWLSIWACYDFRYQPRSGPTSDLKNMIETYASAQTVASHDSTYDVPQEQFQTWRREWKPDGVVLTVQWIAAHHLLPESYLVGFLHVQAVSLGGISFLMGQTSVHGWWYYFPLAMAFKTPLATLVALVLAAIICLFLPRPRDRWAIIALATAPGLYMLSAMHTHMDIGLRHIFPVYPFLYIFLGIIAARAATRFGKPIAVVLAILFIGLTVETFAAFPDFIPFFNVAAGGSRGGARLLSDSNIDWGQELPDLARWQQKNPDYQLMLCYFGAADPRYYGIRYAKLPASFIPTDQTRPTGQQPYWAISVVALQGQYLNSKGKAFYAPFKNRVPTQILGGSIYLYAPW